MNKGCGCVSFVTAVALGLALGIVGLGVAGYFWVDNKVLTGQAAKMEPLKWSRLDEAGLAAKLAPVALSIRRGKEAEHQLKLGPREADRLIDQYIIARSEDMQFRLEFGDTATIIDFCARAAEGRYLNGRLRARISGEDGDFEVTAYSLETGEFKWPKQAMPHVARYIEGVLETQTLFKDDPWRLADYEVKKDDLKVKIRIVPPAGVDGG